jgi:hypothetical protein
MAAPGEVGGLWCFAFAVKIKLPLLSVACPPFFEYVCRLGGSDAESNK